MELTLKEAARIRRDEDKLLVMCHFPPFDVTLADSDYTAIIENSKADAVIYGHLHGKDCRAVKYIERKGVKYYLTSCDQVENKLVKIL